MMMSSYSLPGPRDPDFLISNTIAVNTGVYVCASVLFIIIISMCINDIRIKTSQLTVTHSTLKC